MLSKLPPTIQRLSLPPNVLFWSSTPSQSLIPAVVDNSDDDDDDEFIKNNENTRTNNLGRGHQLPQQQQQQQQQSLRQRSLRQRSLRIQGKGGGEYNVCTAEAVTAALVGLGLTHNDGNQILNLVQKKVDTTLQYQGKNL